jgi:hypothetical protein
MPRSVRFRTLTKELSRLKKQFLPKISPTGLYSDRQLALTLAYRVLAHAEIEAYLEDRVWEVAINAKKDWDNTGKTRRTLICLLAFSGQSDGYSTGHAYSNQFKSRRLEKKLKISKKIDSSISCFKGELLSRIME